MNAARRIVLALSLAAVALVVAGILVIGVCGGGVSLLVFAGAVAAMGAVVARMGGLAILLPASLIVLTLVAAGLLFASGAGCSF